MKDGRPKLLERRYWRRKKRSLVAQIPAAGDSEELREDVVPILPEKMACLPALHKRSIQWG